MSDNTTDYPAVDAAFSFVVPSYQIMAARFEAADSRLNSLTTTVLTLTTAVPVLAKAIDPTVRFASGWFVAAMTAAAVCVVLGLAGRYFGRLTVVDPWVHYKKSLKDSEREFKKNAIGYAGKHFDANAKAIEFKGVLSVWMSLAMAVELVAFAAWMSYWS